jgi:hypothetical protein
VRVTPHSGLLATRLSTVAIAMCIAFASAASLVWKLTAHRAEPPSLDDAGAWQWVATLPGTNVFMHESADQHSAHHIRAWVAFRTYRSPVGVNAGVVELWEFDCIRQLSRRVAGPFDTAAPGELARRGEQEQVRVSAWRHDPSDTTIGAILRRVCSTEGTSNQSNAATLVRSSIPAPRHPVCRRDSCPPS